MSFKIKLKLASFTQRAEHKQVFIEPRNISRASWLIYTPRLLAGVSGVRSRLGLCLSGVRVDWDVDHHHHPVLNPTISSATSPMARTPYPNPVTPADTRVGWIGIGVMGSAMASRLLSAGYSVSVYARDPSKSLPLRSQGALLAHSPLDLARSCDVVFTMLGHPSDVRQIVLDPTSGVVSGLGPNCVAVDTTSSDPALAREIYAAARARRCWSVDAPVSGGDIGARDGKLAIFAGGDRGVVEWLSPLFDAMGRATHAGGPGCGQSCKIANQIVVGANLVGLSEGLVFAERAGLDKRKLLEAVRGGAAGSMAMELFGERMIDRDFRPGGFAEYMVKDLGMGVDFVEDGDGGDRRVAVLPGAALCKQLFSAMVANGDGKLGTQGLITVIERINGK